MVKLALRLIFSICSFAIAMPSMAAPSSDAQPNYEGNCRTDQVVYVEGNNWWMQELIRGIPPVWKYGGVAKRINRYQIIVGDTVFTRIGSPQDNCQQFP